MNIFLYITYTAENNKQKIKQVFHKRKLIEIHLKLIEIHIIKFI